jgi:NADPH:quinone reductase-like Zn-dependent oxidoreductase
MAITGGEGVLYAIDPVGGATGTAVVASLAPNGRALLYGLLSGEPVAVDPRLLLFGCKRVEGFLLSDWARRQNVFRLLAMFRRVIHLIRERVLVTDRVAWYQLADFEQAIARATSAGKDGKMVFRIAEADLNRKRRSK